MEYGMEYGIENFAMQSVGQSRHPIYIGICIAFTSIQPVKLNYKCNANIM
jgi:hypothetical protein